MYLYICDYLILNTTDIFQLLSTWDQSHVWSFKIFLLAVRDSALPSGAGFEIWVIKLEWSFDDPNFKFYLTRKMGNANHQKKNFKTLEVIGTMYSVLGKYLTCFRLERHIYKYTREP